MTILKKIYVLMIAYHFPPIGGSGALRPLKIAKYLPVYGWTPLVMTVKNPDWYYAYDPGLLRELSPDVIVKKSCMLKSAWVYRVLNPCRIKRFDQVIKKYLIHPDESIGWLPFAYFTAKKLINKYEIKAVYSTSGPPTNHIIAYAIKRKTGIPWIADFRDEWFEDPALNMPTRIHKKLHFNLESMIVKKADRIIAMAPEFNKLLKKHETSEYKFSTIYSGFDPDDLECYRENEVKINSADQFIITFTGLFYPTFKPNALIQSINDLIEEGKIEKGEIRIRFVGANKAEDFDVKDKNGICEMVGFVPRDKSFQYMFRSDLLLLLLSKERGRHVIPSKVFEYMSSGKPILALVPSDGEVAEMIRRSNTGYVIDFNDSEGTKKVILMLYQKWQQKKSITNDPNVDEIAKYNQKILVENIANLLNEMVKK